MSTAQAEAETFWHRCRETLGLPAQTRWRTRRLGNSPDVCATLLDLIASGAKTGTFSLLAEFEQTGQAAPVAGEYLLITDYDHRPRCCVRLDRVELRPFDQINEEWINVEGPALRELGAWRDLHREYWSRMLAGWGLEFAPDTPVLCQRFGPPFCP